MNFFKLYIGDYQRDTAHLTLAENGAFFLLLQQFYATEKPLPTGRALHRMLRAQSKADRDAIDSVVRQFWRKIDGGSDGGSDGLITNDRASIEIAKAGDQASTNARIAREREDRRKAARTEHEACTKRARSVGNSLDEDLTPHSHSQTPDLKPTQSSTASVLNTSGTTYPHPPAVRLNGSHAAGLPGIEPKPPKPEKLPDCPHSALVGLYAKHLPQLRQPKVWAGGRVESMRARWRQSSQPSSFGSGYVDTEGGLKFWDRFFAFVAECPKLVKGFQRPDQSRWEPDLPWLMKAENFAKVIEGNYAP